MGDAGVCPSCGRTYPKSSGHCSNDGTRIVPVAPPPQDSLVGRVLDQRYEMRAPLSVGRIGAVYRGWQIHLAREVAVKVIHPSFASDDAAGSRFVDAGRAACQLVAPSVANVYDVARTKDGVLYVVSELVRGESLADRKQRGLSIRRVVAIAMQLTDALDAAHRVPLIHGDLKPSNLIVDESSGRLALKVVDFALAHALAPDITIGDPRRALPVYAAPERFAGRSIDARTDLYSVGAILYELLAGHPPFEATTLDALAAKVHREQTPPLPPNVPTTLQSIVQKLLAKSPNDRFASCKDLRTRLLPIQAQVGEPVAQPARMPTPATGAPYVRGHSQTTPPSVPPSTPPSVPPSVPPTAPSVPPTAQVMPLPLPSAPPSRGIPRFLVIALVAIVLGGAAIGIYFAMQ